MQKFKNVFYQTHINIIGGVETFLYELARVAHKHHRDFVIVYRTGDDTQIERIRNYCRIYQLNELPKPIVCEKAFFNYGLDAIDCFQAKEYIQLIHADFKDASLKNYPPTNHLKITKHYAVSKNNANSWFELTGEKPDVLYNPIIVDEVPRIMTLISPQRMTSEKGVDRMRYMIQELDENNISYIWHIFSNGTLGEDNPNIVYHKPTLDIRKWINYADYLVCLSDTEGYPYSVQEALCYGTPLIITKLPILKEAGVNDRNAIILDFDMKNLDVQEIYDKAGKFKFKYTPKSYGPWLELIDGEYDYTYEPPKFAKLIALIKYYDTQLQRTIERGEVYESTVERAEQLVAKRFADYFKR